MGKTIRREFIIKESDIKIRGDNFRPGHVHRVKTKYTRKKKDWRDYELDEEQENQDDLG